MRFTYKAQKADGTIYEAEREAPDKFFLYRELKKEEETVISVSEVSEGFRFKWRQFAPRRISLHEKIIFARNLAGMTAAGLSLSRALSVLERQTRNAKLQSVIAALLLRIGKGVAFHSALAEFDDVFPPLIISMVKAGEESGNLSGALLTASNGLERIYLLTRKVRGALIYPAVVLSVMLVVGVLLFISVVPQLSAAFTELNIVLPFSTRVIIGTSDLLKNHGLLMAGGFLALACSVVGAARTQGGKRLIDRMFLRLPVLSPLLRELYTARTASTLASLLAAGVEIMSALEITPDVIGNSLYRDVLREAKGAIERGESIATVFRAHEDLYPPLLAEMIAVGEETGKLSILLKDAGIFFEGEVEQRTKNLSTIIEPLIMVIVGVAVGFFAFAMITPMYSLMDSI